jgi:hypothetical protein
LLSYSFKDIGNSVANKGESNDRFEAREYEAKMDLEEALADKKKKQQELFNKKREKDETKFQAGRIAKEFLLFESCSLSFKDIRNLSFY